MNGQDLANALMNDDAATVRAYYREAGEDCDSALRVELPGGAVRYFTPLFMATITGSLNSMEALLSLGADPNCEDADGDTPLNVAAGLFPTSSGSLEQNRVDALSLLVNGHAAINHRNAMGQTALMVACFNEKIDAAAFLLRKYADVSIRDHEGQDALLLAKWSNGVRQGRVPKTELIRMLLKAGADPAEFYGDGFFLTVANPDGYMPKVIRPKDYSPGILDDPTLGTVRLNPNYV